ncbi:hypothetical protein EC973_003015 [Apophysomyces ossiformis]|uniref:Uncharacterized protein n=1 Tax=Apophysomyces ossiformis TaxID=679940 RepID=A0A8H7BQT5_9FUNG|nr:hypothetical protein EC973_003015 [Apophysomyces ossiformis]
MKLISYFLLIASVFYVTALSTAASDNDLHHVLVQVQDISAHIVYQNMTREHAIENTELAYAAFLKHNNTVDKEHDVPVSRASSIGMRTVVSGTWAGGKAWPVVRAYLIPQISGWFRNNWGNVHKLAGNFWAYTYQAGVPQTNDELEVMVLIKNGVAVSNDVVAQYVQQCASALGGYYSEVTGFLTEGGKHIGTIMVKEVVDIP